MILVFGREIPLVLEREKKQLLTIFSISFGLASTIRQERALSFRYTPVGVQS
jgi:hypothetical protein